MSASFFSRLDWRIIAIAAGIMVITIALLVYSRSSDSGQPVQRPTVMVMSSISLQWGEATISQIANGEAETSPLLDALEKSRKTILVDDFQKIGEPGSAPLLLLQPRALAPRELVQLDTWIRNGGSAIIFADPALDWPSDLPLGDPRRPLFTSLLTPLFGHWGLDLALPTGEAQVSEIEVGRYTLGLKSAGLWRKGNTRKPSATCAIRQDERLAYCRVGKGKALLVADADLLHEDQWTDSLVTNGTLGWLESVLLEIGKDRLLSGEFWDKAGN